METGDLIRHRKAGHKNVEWYWTQKKPVILTGISTSKDVNVCLLGELKQDVVNEGKRLYWMVDWYWRRIIDRWKDKTIYGEIDSYEHRGREGNILNIGVCSLWIEWISQLQKCCVRKVNSTRSYINLKTYKTLGIYLFSHKGIYK